MCIYDNLSDRNSFLQFDPHHRNGQNCCRRLTLPVRVSKKLLQIPPVTLRSRQSSRQQHMRPGKLERQMEWSWFYLEPIKRGQNLMTLVGIVRMECFPSCADLMFDVQCMFNVHFWPFFKAEKGPSKDEKEAFDVYLSKFGENRAGENPGYNRQAFPWAGQPSKKTTPKEAIEAVLLANQPKQDAICRKLEMKCHQALSRAPPCYLRISRFNQVGLKLSISRDSQLVTVHAVYNCIWLQL